jgi:hypothetical protein
MKWMILGIVITLIVILLCFITSVFIKSTAINFLLGMVYGSLGVNTYLYLKYKFE